MRLKGKRHPALDAAIRVATAELEGIYLPIREVAEAVRAFGHVCRRADLTDEQARALAMHLSLGLASPAREMQGKLKQTADAFIAVLQSLEKSLREKG